ncbi:hypothetical protein ACHAW6_008881 [Cyclotella cf. meneghiniana]
MLVRFIAVSHLLVLLGGANTNVVSSQRFINCDVTSYYSALPASPTSISRDEMHYLIKATHRNEVPYTSSSRPDVWDALVDLDTDSTGENVHLIYGNKFVPALPHDSGTCGYWNREHLWPRSRGVSDSGMDNTDLHHLRPVDCNVNSARGNRFFAQCGTAEPINECIIPAHAEAASDTERDSLTFLPPAQKRGDIARAIFYMDLRYDGSEPNTLDLVVSDCPTSVPDGAGMGYLSQLLQWHLDDPVDEEEINRNENICANWQGNRNPFVDFPELVSAYFGGPTSVPLNGAGYQCSDSIVPLTTHEPTNSPSSKDTFPPTSEPTNHPCHNLIITGVIDGPLPGGLPKAVELYALGDVRDLSLYGVGFVNNGGGTDGVEFSFPSGHFVAAGSFITIASESVKFATYFGIPPDYVSANVQINGNDAIELFCEGKVVEMFGDGNVDGTGTVWDYMDGWAYRKEETSPNSAFDPGHWTFSGINEIDGCTANSSCSSRFPISSFKS